jgi:hypothetical protein
VDLLARRAAFRSGIALVGLAAATGSLVAGVVLGYLATWSTDPEPNEWLVVGLVVVAVAAPLYGAVAAAHEPRLLPLALGLVVGAAALVWLCALADIPLELPG